MTDHAENDAHESHQDHQAAGLTPELWEWLTRAVADLEPVTREERLWRARTLTDARDSAVGHGGVVLVQVNDFRIAELVEHLDAGRVVIVVPTTHPPD